MPAEVLSRVSACGWLGALLFVPLGYAVVGPVAARIGVDATLWFGAVWVIASSGSATGTARPAIRGAKARTATEHASKGR